MVATALSYLDPSSGSMILQMIAGGTAAIAVTAKLYWRRVTKFLRIRRSDDDDQ
jgi:Na+/proline symporter